MIASGWYVTFWMSRIPLRIIGINVKGSAIEEVPVDVIGEDQTKFIIGLE